MAWNVIDTGQCVTSFEKLSVQTGLTIQQIRTSMQKLISTNEIEKTSTNQFTSIKVLNYSSYQTLQNEINIPINKQNNKPDNTRTTPNKNDEEYKKIIKDIVMFLNQTCSTNFKHTTEKTQSIIKARLNEGFTVDDFKTVINKKFNEWNKDNKMSKYLRPQTLFGNNFEGYLNQKGDENATSIKNYKDSRFGTFI
jgi:uncharacterized phage protein (TIGR02220 family)